MAEASDREPATRCGNVVLLGPPNAGKSTLLNRLVGEKLAIVSPRPQTTWVPVVGILTEGDTQIVLIDPPGLVDPREPMHDALVGSAVEAARTADAVIHIASACLPRDNLRDTLPDDVKLNAPVLEVYSQIDRCDAATPDGALGVSAVSGEGVPALIGWCRARMPRREFRYPAEDVGTQPLRFFVAEFVREAAFENLAQELPYSLAVEVEEFREEREPVYIRVNCYVERESQKAILIGTGGQTIRDLGKRARGRIEELVGRRVYLDLWVKVRHKWRRKPGALREFGYLSRASRKREL